MTPGCNGSVCLNGIERTKMHVSILYNFTTLVGIEYFFIVSFSEQIVSPLPTLECEKYDCPSGNQCISRLKQHYFKD